MVIDNDTRGWIMTVVSGIACTFGASIICVDLIIRQFPGKRNFKIEDSNLFLSTGLSLSFGVMVFSSLYSMLPSAKKYLTQSGMSPRNASFTLIGCFLAGALGISVLSSILHQYIPHSVVDCDHEHSDEEEGKLGGEDATDELHQPMQAQQQSLLEADRLMDANGNRSYGTDLENVIPRMPVGRPSSHTAISSRVSQLVTGSKSCDDNAHCFGYSDTCGTECFRNVSQSRPAHLKSKKSLGNLGISRPSGLDRIKTTQVTNERGERRALLEDQDESTPLMPTRSGPTIVDGSTASLQSTYGHSVPTTNDNKVNNIGPEVPSITTSHASHENHEGHDHDHDHDHASTTHHHHVPNNVFLSIGLQTSIAIALHKIPEGFITYATNHANPTLGLSIFIALFIHNITEGFALALPLYLAINSRWKAMVWSTLLGGVSQPLGAGVAALWFDGEPGELVYGCMFALTAGIMAMVSLQLLGESLDLTHSRRSCFISAFAGMGVLGLSSALTA